MALEVFSNEHARPRGEVYITTDKQGRIYLSKAAQKTLGVFSDVAELHSVELFVFYDIHNKTIGLAKPDVVKITDVKPFRFSGKEGRKYSSSRAFLNHYGILPDGVFDRYYYNGKTSDGIHTFLREGVDVSKTDNAHKPEPAPTKSKRGRRKKSDEEVAQ